MKKRIVSLLLALVMAVGLTLPAYAEGAPATGGSVSYMKWDGTNKRLVAAAIAESDCTVVTRNDDNVTWGAENTTTYYVVNTDVTINGTVTAYGDVHLILCDNAKLTVNGGVVVVGNSDGGNMIRGNLTIYGQENQTGKLVANGGTDENFSAGIKFKCYGNLTINGGEIEATGGDDTRDPANTENHEDGIVTRSYGIYATTSVVINDGKLTAKGGTPAPYNEEYNETCSGGIYAYEMTVNGGEVTATGGRATGASGESYGIQAALEINGGTLIAKSAAGKAVVLPAYATLTPPIAFWWRTADSGAYNTQNTYTDSALTGTCFELVTTKPANVNADTPVPYLDWDDGEEELTNASCTEYTLVKPSSDDVTWSGGWYVVDGNVTIGKKLRITGDVHLILCDGATLTVWEGIVIGGDSDRDQDLNFTIYGQSGKTGKLVANGDSNESQSFGIDCYGNLTINGGVIEATGKEVEASTACSYGIFVFHDLTIRGGNVTATGGEAEGDYAESGGIYVLRGNMTVKGGKVTAEGGDVDAYGYDDYCEDAYSYGIYVGKDMTIEGENTTVTATGGEADSDDGDAESYGIYVDGYYDDDDHVNLTIKGGTVIATGGDADADEDDNDAYSCGIYVYGYDSDADESYGNLTIESGNVTATGGSAEADYAYSYGIRACTNLDITASEVVATGGEVDGDYRAYSYGIRAGNDLTIKSGTVIAKTTATDSDVEKAAVQCNTGILPAAYWWHTVKDGAYSKFPTTAYVYNSVDTYVKITTTDPSAGSIGGDETPQPPQPQPPQPNPPANPDSSGSGGSTHRPSGGQSATVNSAKTFDPGIAAYVVMGGISTVTSAAWIRRRKK